ncbi:MAG: hypothetical protein HY078_10440 [Elusimicrobia bacterium]|nr:hypothetical protein [Elusimicrobiota bacterium]
MKFETFQNVERTLNPSDRAAVESEKWSEATPAAIFNIVRGYIANLFLKHLGRLPTQDDFDGIDRALSAGVLRGSQLEGILEQHPEAARWRHKVRFEMNINLS